MGNYNDTTNKIEYIYLRVMASVPCFFNIT